MLKPLAVVMIKLTLTHNLGAAQGADLELEFFMLKVHTKPGQLKNIKTSQFQSFCANCSLRKLCLTQVECDLDFCCCNSSTSKF